MLSCTILCNNGSESLIPLVHRIHEIGGSTFLHVDQKATRKIVAIADVLARKLSSCELLPSLNATWGGYSLVDATMTGFRRGYPNADWLILLSDTHLPIQPLIGLENYLDGLGADAVMLHRPCNLNDNDLHAGGRFKFSYIEKPGLGIIRGPARQPRHPTMFLGSQWIAMRSCFFRDLLPEFEAEQAWYRESFVPDEAFFHNVALNRRPSCIVNTSLTYQNWLKTGPEQLDTIAPPSGRDRFFARKYSSLPRDLVLTEPEKQTHAEANASGVDRCDEIAEPSITISLPGQAPVAEFEGFALAYIANQTSCKIRRLAAERTGVHEIQLHIEQCPGLFLLWRETTDFISMFVASNTHKLIIPTGHPLIAPDALRTPLIRYRSCIDDKALYAASHPALARLSFMTKQAEGTESLENFIKAWIDIFLDIIGKAATIQS